MYKQTEQTDIKARTEL